VAHPSTQAHWDHVYTTKDPTKVSWYEPTPARSLALIEALGLPPAAAILDVGGGTSGLAGALLEAGYTDVTVADISSSALEHAQAQLGTAADRVGWIKADVRTHPFDRRYDLWHDRALFHFMIEEQARFEYMDSLRRALRSGGHVIIATFGPDAPTHCSGLPVSRYRGEELATEFGDDFELISAELEDHITPGGGEQQFLYAHLRHQERRPTD
jgi:SAM-dependent methyltransferase